MMTREEVYEYLYDMIKENDLDFYNEFESRTCKNCKWNQESVCTNSDSLLCADFIDDEFGCIVFERIKK